MKGSDGAAGSSWNDGEQHKNDYHVSDTRYTSERIDHNAMIATPSTYNTNKALHPVPQPVEVKGWSNTSQYGNYQGEQDHQNTFGQREGDESERVSQRKNYKMSTLHILTYSGPGGGTGGYGLYITRYRSSDVRLNRWNKTVVYSTIFGSDKRKRTKKIIPASNKN